MGFQNSGFFRSPEWDNSIITKRYRRQGCRALPESQRAQAQVDERATCFTHTLPDHTTISTYVLACGCNVLHTQLSNHATCAAHVGPATHELISTLSSISVLGTDTGLGTWHSNDLCQPRRPVGHRAMYISKVQASCLKSCDSALVGDHTAVHLQALALGPALWDRHCSPLGWPAWIPSSVVAYHWDASCSYWKMV